MKNADSTIKQLFEDGCDINATELEEAWLKLSSNRTDGYATQCSSCLESLNAAEPDISSESTFWSLVIYAAIGWSVALSQALIVLNIRNRMERILKMHQATEADQILGLLQRLQGDLVERTCRQMLSALDIHASD